MPLPVPLGASAEEVRGALAPLRNDFSVAVWTPGNAFAVGAVIRVAHSFLAREVLLVGGERHYEKASMGMHRYERIVRVGGASELRDAVGGRPLWALEKDHARRSLHEVKDFPRDVVFLFGSERSGLPDEALASADETLGIPIYGVNHSLPVAVAAGIVMNEWARRKYAAGAVV